MTVCNHSASERLLNVVEFCPIPNACMPRCICVGGGRLTAGQEAQAHDNLTAEKMNLLAVAKLLNMFEDEIQTTEDAWCLCLLHRCVGEYEWTGQKRHDISWYESSAGWSFSILRPELAPMYVCSYLVLPADRHAHTSHTYNHANDTHTRARATYTLYPRCVLFVDVSWEDQEEKLCMTCLRLLFAEFCRASWACS